MKAASQRGYRVLVEQSDAAADVELNALQGPFRQLTDGLLFTPLAMEADAIAGRLGKKPLVMLGEHILDPRFDLVTMKNEEAAAALTAHLVAERPPSDCSYWRPCGRVRRKCRAPAQRLPARTGQGRDSLRPRTDRAV
jgi:DNA-binding LacI/PurR family transcriptional regulator